MKCTLDGGNARVIAKAIQSLSRFGTELFVEADKNGLILRSLNSSKSAVGTFKFNRHFFVLYGTTTDDSYCKLSMKACLAVFRNMKQVEQCELKIIPEHRKFQVQLKCRLETVKNSSIAILDDENISAAVSLTGNSNSINGSYRIFNEISSNFNAAEEEITLEAHNDILNVKNYIEGSRVNDKFMRSQLKLLPAEFNSYQIGQETTITFCLKEFRAFLMFAESLNENLILNFKEAGSPLILQVNKFDQIECVLIMSTLCPEDVSFYDDCRESEVADISAASSTLKRKRNPQHSKTKRNADSSRPKRGIAEESTLSNDTLFQFNSSTSNGLHSLTSVGAVRNCNDSSNGIATHGQPVSNLLTLTSASKNTLPEEQRESEVYVTFFETEENNNGEKNECIPQSPRQQLEARNARSIFLRCFESTYIPKEPTPDSQVYVPNSDSED